MILGKRGSLKSKAIAVAVLASQTVFLAPSAVLAADIRVAGQSVFALTTTDGGMTADQRVDTIQRNLDNALIATKDRSAAAVNIVYIKGLPVVTLGGYQVFAVGEEAAKGSGSTPALLAQSFADSLRQVLADSSSIQSYVSQLTGDYARTVPPALPTGGDTGFVPRQPAPAGAYPGDYSTYRGQNQLPGGQSGQYKGRVAYIPAGMTIPVVLRTSISTTAARAGDLVEAQVSQPIGLGDVTIPAGSIVTGMITQADPGRRLERSGDLSIKFTALRIPDGPETPISAHIIGGIGKYKQIGSDQSGAVKGEGWGTKVGQFALRSAVGAGTGAALGTAVGAIAGHSGTSTGRGAWSGAAIGGGLGAADSLLLRKGKEVNLLSGQLLQLQLDAPAQLSLSSGAPYSGTF